MSLCRLNQTRKAYQCFLCVRIWGLGWFQPVHSQALEQPTWAHMPHAGPCRSSVGSRLCPRTSSSGLWHGAGLALLRASPCQPLPHLELRIVLTARCRFSGAMGHLMNSLLRRGRDLPRATERPCQNWDQDSAVPRCQTRACLKTEHFIKP